MTVTKPSIDPKLISILQDIYDPEIPVLSIVDMGVVRSAVVENGVANIRITPTYSGCPAMDTIAEDIKKTLLKKGYHTQIELVLYPPWTTDRINLKGRKALKEYGIASPLDVKMDKMALLEGKKIVKCPNCQSTNTRLVSQFGSTACKAQFQCEDCQEPFDYFKCLK